MSTALLWRAGRPAGAVQHRPSASQVPGSLPVGSIGPNRPDRDFLGYQLSPRLADSGSATMYRADPDADYGPLNPLTRDKVNL
ncbi:Tn3 family transposase [Streptomyces sp. NPDC006984]|uniref:Tn3 family transposase n=1 Tax=Streptomyces sp. NPDC006984 TaxID=3155463 RepID=UPI0033F58371